MYTVVMAFLLSLALSSGTRSNTRKNIEFCQKIELQLLDDDDDEKECRYAPMFTTQNPRVRPKASPRACGSKAQACRAGYARRAV